MVKALRIAIRIAFEKNMNRVFLLTVSECQLAKGHRYES